MKLLPVVLLVTLVPGLLRGQDTTYFNADWQIISSGDTASFYRVIAPFKKDLHTIRDYYRSGQIQMDGTCFVKDTIVRHGEFTYYFEDGRLHATATYEKGNRQGEYVEYNPNGTLHVRASYKKGKRIGRWTSYYPDGTVRSDYDYDKNGTMTIHTVDEETLEPDIDGFYHVLNVHAKFVHDGVTLKDYILPKLTVPEKAKDHLDGLFNAGQYFLDERGKVIQYKPHQRLGFGLDEQLEAIMLAMPHWQPGLLKGRPVPFKWTLVIEIEDGVIIDIHT